MTDSISGLSQNFQLLIDSIMTYERKPLETLTHKRDQISIHRGVYMDLRTKLDSLQRSVRSLIPGDALSSFSLSRKVLVTPGLSGATVATATANASAIPGSYDLSVTQLARAERRVFPAQTGAKTPLQKDGTLWVGGQNTPSASIEDDPGIILFADGAQVSTVNASLRELSTGTYRVETRVQDGVNQFRLVDSNGTAVGIADLSKTDHSLTTGWQTLPSGEYDTGRGLTLNLNGTTGQSAAISYTARGAGIDVNPEDTLYDIASKINAALQPDGHSAVASVVGSQLVLTAATAGDQHAMLLLDESNLLGEPEVKAGRPALFSVNGVDFSTQSNTNLNDVIYGVSLNLAPDAESPDGPRTATIQVKEDTAAARTAIQTFVDRLNDIQGYISAKSAITKTGETTATRGALSDDLIFNDLRDRLYELTMSSSTNAGRYHFLTDIGISIDNNLSVSISDSDKLEKALTMNFEDTRALLGDVMTRFQSVLTGFTGTEGYMQNAIKGFDTEKVDLEYSISDFEKRLTVRKDALVNQYAQMQATLISLSYQQQMMDSLYSSLSLLT